MKYKSFLNWFQLLFQIYFKTLSYNKFHLLYQLGMFKYTKVIVT